MAMTHMDLLEMLSLLLLLKIVIYTIIIFCTESIESWNSIEKLHLLLLVVVVVVTDVVARRKRNDEKHENLNIFVLNDCKG